MNNWALISLTLIIIATGSSIWLLNKGQDDQASQQYSMVSGGHFVRTSTE